MLKLYYTPGSCSTAIHVVLNEIKAEFELIDVSVPAGQPRSSEYLAINPRGSVPTLVLSDGTILRESAAILLYLLENYENNLLPKDSKLKAKTLEWLCFANSTLHPAYSRCFFQHRMLGEEAAKNPLYKPSIKLIQKYWDEIELHLASSKYLSSDQISVADILVTVVANWSLAMREPIIFGNKTKEFFSSVIAMPSFQAALTKEGVVYKANF